MKYSFLPFLPTTNSHTDVKFSLKLDVRICFVGLYNPNFSSRKNYVYRDQDYDDDDDVSDPTLNYEGGKKIYFSKIKAKKGGRYSKRSKKVNYVKLSKKHNIKRLNVSRRKACN